MIRTALDQCKDSKLYVAMNLSFACSLRMGEILGLTWDNVHISDEDIAEDNAYVYIDKELTRASKRAIETLGEKDIYYIFTPLFPKYKYPPHSEKAENGFQYPQGMAAENPCLHFAGVESGTGRTPRLPR